MIGLLQCIDQRLEIDGIRRLRKALARQPVDDVGEGRRGGQPARRLQRVAVVGDLERRHDAGTAFGEVGCGQHAARGCNVGRNRLCDVALVEIVRALLGEPRQRVGEVAENERRRFSG